MDLYEAIQSRHMIRSYDGESVDREVLDRILNSAALAPSSKNSQPWRFHVATGEMRDKLAEAMSMCTLSLFEYLGITDPKKMADYEKFFADLGGAPVFMAVSVPTPEDELERINSYVSAGCALENLLLSAVAEGLGCCNITASFWVRENLAEILELTEGREIISLVLVGHPAAEPLAPPHEMEIATFHE